jgi:hypothetical protein
VSRILLALLLGLAAATAARAEELFDGTKPLLCASSEAYDCSGDECLETSTDGLGVPDLLRVDPVAKNIRALDVAQRDLESSPVSSVRVEQRRLLLSGREGETRGWTLAIDQDTGDSVLTVHDAGTGVIVFGECTAL